MSAEAEIRSYAERIARLETERRELASDIKDVKAECKARGFNVKLVAACVRLMLLEQGKQDAALREHEELDIYLNAVGLLDGGEANETRQDAGGIRQGHMAPASVATDTGAVDGAGDADVVSADPVPAPDDQVSPEGAADIRAAVEQSTPNMRDKVVAPTPAHGSATPAAEQEAEAGRDGVMGTAPSSGPVTKSGVTVGGDESGTAARWVSHSAAEGAPRPGGECGAEPRPAPVSPERALDTALSEWEARDKARRDAQPLDLSTPMGVIRFKVRHGRDPRPDETEARP